MTSLRINVAVAALIALSASAQNAVVPTGAEGTGSGGTLSYTIGQVAFNRPGSLSGTVAEGVQQPFEVFSTSIADEATQVHATITPNATGTGVEVMLGAPLNGPVRVELTDATGRLLMTDRMKGSSIAVPMEALPAALYLVSLEHEGRTIASFKIIKN